MSSSDGAHDAQLVTPLPDGSRRAFLGRVGAGGAALLAGACVTPRNAPPGMIGVEGRAGWDVGWADRVREARHRAVFDAPNGDSAFMLAARWLDNVDTVYGARSPDAAAVLNVRTGAVALGLSDAAWQRFPIAEDRKWMDPATSALARRNPQWSPAPAMSAAEADTMLERLVARGAIVLVCDFALGHLANRLATATGGTRDAVHAALRQLLVPGATLVPSGIFGLVEAQNAGCGYVPG